MPEHLPIFTKTFHTSVYPSIDPSTNPALSANGKVVLVTGGGRGIGKAIATSFAQAGARTIVILGRTASSLEEATKSISNTAKTAGHATVVRSFTADVCDALAVSKIFMTASDEFGGIDIVINNAGGLHLGTLETADSEEYWRNFEINVKGTVNVIQALTQSRLEKSDAAPATFINLSTVGLAMPTFPTWSNYVSSKLAAFTITSFLAVESGGKIRAFSIHPGRIETEMAGRAGLTTFDDTGLPGALCAWLAATPEADFLQGRLVASNWDVDELLQMREEIETKGLLKMKLVGLGM